MAVEAEIETIRALRGWAAVKELNLGLRALDLGVLPPYNEKSNGKEHGKWNGNRVGISGFKELN